MPLTYFFYTNPNIELSWESEEGQETRRRLFYWLCATLLKSVYSSGTYTKVEGIREVLRNAPKGTFPMKDLSKRLYSYSETLSFPEEEVRDMIRTLRSTNKRVLVLLSLLYYPDPANEHVEYEIDHVFPRSELSMENLVNNHDFSLERAEIFDNLRDNVRNLQLVRKTTNRSKGDQLFKDWIESRNGEYFERHYIPQNSDLYRVERFDEFIQKREELVVDRIRNMSEEVEKALEAELEQIA